MDANVLYYSVNEWRSGVPVYLPQAQTANLPVDYGWLDAEKHAILVERKELRDLASSLRSGHLRVQLEAAKDETAHVWLLCEGNPKLITPKRVNLPGKWTYNNFWKALIALLYGLQVGGPLWADNPQESALLLSILYEQTHRIDLGAGRPVLPKWQHTPKGTVAESFARALPMGIGYGRAVALEEVTPSWVKLAQASVGLLEKAKGIGPILARRIHDFLRKEAD